MEVFEQTVAADAQQKIDQANEAAAEKAKLLSEQLSVEVHPLVFMNGEEIITGFFTEPNRMTKLRVMDKGLSAPITAAAECLEAVLLRDHSDPRIMSPEPENDKIYMGAVMCVYETIKTSINQFKKK
jgi:hypothetical protein